MEGKRLLENTREIICSKTQTTRDNSKIQRGALFAILMHVNARIRLFLDAINEIRETKSGNGV